MSSKTRQRRGKKQTAPPEATAIRNNASSSEPRQSTDEKTLSQIFWGHPLIVVLPYVMIPYLLYHAYHYVLLQRPELLSPFATLRPALAITEPRQVLIVGTMSSGTTQVAHELSTHFGLEVQHEVSDSTSYFCRDGTVSWFHGIRFLSPPASIERMAPLCVNFTQNMGFHPRMYAAQSCSSWQTWSACWMKSCFEVLQREWGCTQRPNHHCETPFRVTLWQVRHPLRTMESLTAKFCNGKSVHPSLVTFVEALFPSKQKPNTCLEWVAYYVLEYSQAMLLAHQRGDIVHWYRVEETSPCQVAALAGFLNDSSTVPQVAQKCRDNELLQQPMISTQYKINQNVTLTMSDFSNEYARRIKKLIQALGYTEDFK
ncbi:hypothetical protein FisN_33Lu049 [Fistulifera solaris]|uniref:Sulfotransferase domain-containing protein n=1 Tax=Fistulifera solaris TaxID=1519565 RepID=A0A1Z5KA64_FISSO|nr:hypothetical protein FisN_33Lu049 [Fistulifera solaris]|eukprot:GAX23153.1 hypothetical protein FisN_33Lu049 [Fistulifera solaris]